MKVLLFLFYSICRLNLLFLEPAVEILLKLPHTCTFIPLLGEASFRSFLKSTKSSIAASQMNGASQRMLNEKPNAS
jgi:hypothetical protein